MANNFHEQIERFGLARFGLWQARRQVEAAHRGVAGTRGSLSSTRLEARFGGSCGRTRACTSGLALTFPYVASASF